MTERIKASDLPRAQGAATNKYGARPAAVDGIRFDSQHEARRWAQLRLLEQGGEITDLQRQVPLILQGRDDVLRGRAGRPMRITVDFSYVDIRTGLRVYEDAKGMPTRDYEVRRAVAAAQGVEIVEV